MDTYISAQFELLEQIKRTHSNFKKLPKDRLNINYINTKLQLLDQTWSNIQENHLKLLRSYDKKVLATTNYVADDIYFTAEEEYTITKVTMLDKLQNITPQIQNQTTDKTLNSSTATPVDIKIPTLKIPTFNGNYTEWHSFHDQFVSLIHENDSLKNVQKLHYLKAHVVGEAANLIKNIAVIDKNYEYAWEKLKRRFSNKRVIVNAYLHKLMSIRNIHTESPNAIKYLLDTTTECLSGLNSVDVNTDSWDAIVIFLIVNKLDTESLKQWEEKINRENDDKLPTFHMLTEFLEARFRSLEGIQSNRVNIGRPRQNTQHIEKKVYHASKTESKKSICTYCNGDHFIQKCKQFIDLSYEDKKKVIEEKQLCFNCLVPYHGVKICKYDARCHICGKKHHSLIHPPPKNIDEINTACVRNREEASVEEIQNIEFVSNEGQDIITHLAMEKKPNILLATALVKVRAENGRIRQLRALIDQGSEGSFITESAAQALGLKRKTVNGSISGIGDSKTFKVKHKVTFMLQSFTVDEFNLSVDAYVLKTLTRLLPSTQVLVAFQHIQGLPLADPTYGIPGRIDLLLGAAVYSRIINNGVVKGPPGSPLAQNTQLGWILSGEININCNERKKSIISMHLTTNEDNELLRKFWEIESSMPCTSKKRMTEEELECEKIYESTYTRDVEGRYVVKLPIKDSSMDYGNTKNIANQRLDQLERRLDKDRELKEEYNKVLMEYKELGHMEEIDSSETIRPTNEIFYLPHHAVIRRDKTTSKVRIVFNASSKGPKGKSLNDNMYVGPTIQRELRHIVMTWRTYEVAFVADCIKMYRQIKVTDKCANLQRLLWREHGKLKEYKLTRVTFGTASAPYLATKTVQILAHNEKEKFPIAAKIAMNDFYMDDLLTGADNLEEAKEIYNQITKMMKTGGFEMQKWACNNKIISKYIEKAENAADDNTYVVKNDDVVKTLGIRWDRNIDKFQYVINMDHNHTEIITKRTVLSTISRLFDPIGWLAPVIVTAKIFIQKLWLAGIDWDEEIPNTLKEEWNEYRRELNNCKDITINRWLQTNKEDLCHELHGYCDASTMAYAAVVYIRIVKKDGSIHTHLISAKTKVAPIKTISVPRLELCGAVLLANLLMEVAEQLNIKKDNTFAYCDSKVVLAWLQSHPSRWKTFVANRTAEIINLLPSQHWHHVASECNPADVASRGIFPSQLLNYTLWWKGPKNLKQKNPKYELLKDNITNLEEKTIKVMTIMTTNEFNLFEKYSNLTKLLRVTAYLLRVFKKNKPNHLHLSGQEIDNAMIKCVIMCQNQTYLREKEELEMNRPIHNNSKLKSLNPFLDPNQIIRVGGRLTHANIPHDSKHQIILPENHPFTKLILSDCHVKTLHGGPMLMLSHLRTKFWITHAKSLLRKVLHKCVTCTRYRASTATQMMGSLPKPRVTPARPFLNSGVDLAGPIDLRLSKGRGCKTQKGYIVIFICMATRAIHIEIVTGLTAQEFIAAFKRFVGRRGKCKNIWSDNATNLTASNKELMSSFEKSIEQVRKEIEELLANDGTTWHHIPAAAPHFGGLWEAGVKSII